LDEGTQLPLENAVVHHRQHGASPETLGADPDPAFGRSEGIIANSVRVHPEGRRLGSSVIEILWGRGLWAEVFNPNPAHVRSLGPVHSGTTFMGIFVPAGTSIPLRTKAAEKAAAMLVGADIVRRVELGPEPCDHLPATFPRRFDLFACGRCRCGDEVVFSIWLSLRVLLVDGDDLHVLREEVTAFTTEPIDRIGEAKAAVLDEGGALADVATLL
jgi:hypothetical protein